MANEFDVLMKQLEILEKIVIKGSIVFDEKTKNAAINVVQKIQFVEEQIMGDKFENISQSTIVNRSLLKSSLNSISKKYGNDFKNALEEVASFIDESKRKESADLFDKFNEELSAGKPNKSILKVLWEGLVKTLPDTAKIASAIATVAKMFL